MSYVVIGNMDLIELHKQSPVFNMGSNESYYCVGFFLPTGRFYRAASFDNMNHAHALCSFLNGGARFDIYDKNKPREVE